VTPVEHAVAVGASTVTTRRYPTADAPRARIVLAHGAGTDQRHRVMVALAGGLAARGVEAVTFNFLYSEQRRRSPDRAPVLEQTWEAVVDAVAADLADGQRLVIGGKSMGGRIASMVLARTPGRPSWAAVSGLVLLGYPLHPPGKPEQPRTAHLPSLRVPVLLVQGTRDPFGTREEIEPVFRALPTRVDYEFIEQGDHGFAVPKSTGLTEAAVLDRIATRVAGWVLG
jgi:predicted alpha/beta-hydrolase family hydrolase